MTSVTLRLAQGRAGVLGTGERCSDCGPGVAMSCTIEKILTDAKTLLERLGGARMRPPSHWWDQSAALHRRGSRYAEAGTALPGPGQAEGMGPCPRVLGT